MSCEDAAPLLHASLDGELDSAHEAELERHLAGCGRCAEELARQRVLKAAVRASASRHRLDPVARQRVEASLGSTSAPARRAAAMPRRAVLGGSVAASLLVGFGLGTWLGPGLRPPDGAGLAEDVLAAHVRGLQPGHAIDVASSNRHTVNPWFAGRVGFSPPVKDLASDGFVLVGGRLDQVGRHAAAVVVYQRGQHQIDLFVWPEVAEPGVAPPAAASRDGYNLRSWLDGGLRLTAVSGLNAAELDGFVARWRAA